MSPPLLNFSKPFSVNSYRFQSISVGLWNSNRFLFRRSSQAPKSSFSLVHTPFVTQSFLDLCSILPAISIELKVAIQLSYFCIFINLVKSNVVNRSAAWECFFFSFSIFFFQFDSIQHTHIVPIVRLNDLCIVYSIDSRKKESWNSQCSINTVKNVPHVIIRDDNSIESPSIFRFNLVYTWN